jgi:hypothetical protein
MPSILRKVDLNSGGLKHLIVLLGDDDRTLLFQLGTRKQVSDTTVDVIVDITEQQADLLIKIAAYR